MPTKKYIYIHIMKHPLCCEVFYLWRFHFVVLFLAEFVRNYGKQIKLELCCLRQRKVRTKEMAIAKNPVGGGSSLVWISGGGGSGW